MDQNEPTVSRAPQNGPLPGRNVQSCLFILAAALVLVVVLLMLGRAVLDQLQFEPTRAPDLVPAEPTTTVAVVQGPVEVFIQSPQAGETLTAGGFEVSGYITPGGARGVMISARDSGGALVDQAIATSDAAGNYRVSLASSFSFPVASESTVTVAALDAQNQVISEKTVSVRLADSGAPPASPIPIIAQEQPPADAGKGGLVSEPDYVVGAPAGAVITHPVHGQHVTFPIHVAGYLNTPGNAEVDLQFVFDYAGQQVSGTGRTVTWGRINVFIFNLDIPGGIGAHPAASTGGVLSVFQGGQLLAQRQVYLVGQQASKQVQVYFLDAFGGLQAVPRRVPIYGGSNDALNELFWGPSNQEGYNTAIPNPRQVRQYVDTASGNPLNAIVHVLASHVDYYGNATLTISPSIQGSPDPGKAAEQIRATMAQFSNVKQVIIYAGGVLWQSGGVIVTALPPMPDTPAPPTTQPTEAQITISDPGDGVLVGATFRVSGTATAPLPGDAVLLQLVTTPGFEVLSNQYITVLGAEPGQVGFFEIDVSYTPPAAPTQATLTVSYLQGPSGHVLTQEVRNISLTTAPAGAPPE